MNKKSKTFITSESQEEVFLVITKEEQERNIKAPFCQSLMHQIQRKTEHISCPTQSAD